MSAICNNCGEDLHRHTRWGGWFVHQTGNEECADGNGRADPVCMVCGLPVQGAPGMRCSCSLPKEVDPV